VRASLKKLVLEQKEEILSHVADKYTDLSSLATGEPLSQHVLELGYHVSNDQGQFQI